MVGSTYINQQEVWNACDDFVQQGRKDINAKSIHDYLGHGSISTIQKFLNNWRHARNNEVLAIDVPIPEIVQDAFKNNNRQVWSMACAEAQRMTESHRETSLLCHVDLLVNKLELANKEITELTTIAEERLRQIEEYRNQIIEFAGEIARLTQLEDNYNKELTLAQEILRMVGIENREVFRQIMNNPQVQQYIMALALKPSDTNLPPQG